MNYKKLILIPLILMLGQQAIAMQGNNAIDKLKKITASLPWKTVGTTAATLGTAYIMNGTSLDTPLAWGGVALGATLGALYTFKNVHENTIHRTGRPLDALVKANSPYNYERESGEIFYEELKSHKPALVATGALAVTAIVRGAYLLT